MSVLTDFLLARIAEDEAVAHDFVPEEVASPSLERQRYIRARGDWVVLYDPARVLAECEAKREIVRYYLLLCEQAEAQERPFHFHSTGLLYAVRTHAAVYADHPDYRDEWRP